MTAAPDSDVVLRTAGLTRRYGKFTAVDSLDLEVRRGQVFGFLGPNGSGKTTTIGMLLGLLRPTSGRIDLFGSDVAHGHSAALRRTGAVLEGPAFYPHLSGRDNLRVWSMVAESVPGATLDRVLELVGLAQRAKSKVATYSLGMRQRLALAAALMTNPDLVVLDEPTNGLDPAGMREIRQVIRDLGRAGKTVFVSSHLLGEVEQMCDYVGILKSGRLLTQGSVADLLRQGEALILEVTDADTAVDVLRGLDFINDVRREGNRLTLDAPRQRAADVSRALADRGVYLHELRPQEGSLEDFFLEVTGEGEAGA